MTSESIDARMRAAMFAYLDRLADRHPVGGLPSNDINAFEFEGSQVRLVMQPGIRKPQVLDAALTIRTTFVTEHADRPYEDGFGEDGLLRYKWRGDDPNHADNRALRRAMELHLPLAYFNGIAKGVYQAYYPVYLIAEDPLRQEFTVDLLEPADAGVPSALDRRYAERLTLQRLHQDAFRTRVLTAYEEACALCRLRHTRLLDAAHILEDRHEHGDPIVPNGLALCKIHHAAYDANIIGIRPDRRVEVSAKVLAEVNGPMLRHGLQEMHGTVIFLPPARRDRPDPERLAERYARFQAA